MKKIVTTIAAFALVAGCIEEESKTGNPAALQDRSPVELAEISDMESGGMIATWCSDCHGRNGISETAYVPHLAGQRMDYVVNELKAYKDGTRDNPAMRTVVDSLTDDAMKNVAAYYSLRGVGGEGDPAQPAGTPSDIFEAAPSVAQWIHKCDRCHEGSGFADPGRFPILTGQREEYLARALHIYQNRFLRNSSMMHAMTEQLNPQEIREISAYYAHRPAVQTVGFVPRD